MEQQKLTIDHNYVKENFTDFSEIKTTAQKILNASQCEFETIKNEKWFTRFFDIITLSKKNEIRIGKQVSTLAQAQQLLLEILLRLSANNVEMSDLLNNAHEKISQLASQNIKLAKLTRHIENIIIYGIPQPQEAVTNFTEQDKSILSGVISVICEQFNDLSSDQKKYANSLLRTICQQSCKLPDPYKTVSLIENNSIRKRMFYCAMELIFLYNNSFRDDSKVQYATDLFDFGRKVVSDTKASIEREYHIRGTSGISEQFGNTEDESFSNEFFCDFVGFDTDDSSEKETVFIEQCLDIPEGKQKTYKNAEITIGSFITCSGELHFENCHIIFGLAISKDSQIILNDGSKVNFENCSFEQKHLIEYDGEKPLPFLYQPDTSNVQISISRSTFTDCGYILGTGSAASNSHIEISDCHIINPLWGFIDVSHLTGKMVTSRITIKDHSEWAKQLDKYNSNNSGVSLFGISRKGGEIFTSSRIGEDGFIVKNCIAEAGGDLLSKDVKLFSLGGSYTDNVGAVFENCTFINLSNCITEAIVVSKSFFNNCQNCISKLSSSLVDSVFYRVVSAVSSIEEKATIIGCQFIECGGNKSLVETSFWGNVSIEYCQFVNIKYVTGFKWKDKTAGILSFKRSKGRGYKSSVSRCEFVSLYSDKAYIVSCPIIEKTDTPFVELTQCKFSQCGTGEGGLLQENSYYLGLFDREITVGGLIKTVNCSGEKDNCREYKHSQDFSPRSESRSGEKIGSFLQISPEITYTPIFDNTVTFNEANADTTVVVP